MVRALLHFWQELRAARRELPNVRPVSARPPPEHLVQDHGPWQDQGAEGH